MVMLHFAENPYHFTYFRKMKTLKFTLFSKAFLICRIYCKCDFANCKQILADCRMSQRMPAIDCNAELYFGLLSPSSSP